MVQERDAAGPMVGQEIYTHDGDHIGKVKEVHGDRFKVDAPMQPDYWLPTNAIGQPAGDRLTLTFAKDQLGEYKIDGPPSDEHEAAQTGGAGAGSSYEPTVVPYTTGFTEGLAEKAWEEAEPVYRQEWEGRNASAGRRWDEVSAGYRYAHAMSGNPRYQGREWDEVEVECEGEYEEWRRREGQPEWDRAREGAREAWLVIVRRR
jgi:hypothetical protein